MSDNRQMKFDLLTNLSQAVRDIDQLSTALDKLKDKKLTNNISDSLKAELQSASNIVNQEGQKVNNILNGIGANSSQGITKYVSSYKQAISSMTSDIEKYNRLFKETGNQDYANKANALIPQVRQLNAEYNALNKTIGLNTKSLGMLDNAFSNLKNHAAWLATSAILGGAIALPGVAIGSMANIEQQMAGMLQTLPSLYADYPNHIVNQRALNEVTKEFIGISQRYGHEVDKVIEAGKLWSRGYKQVADVMALTGNSTKLAIADMMDVSLANRAVESTINSYKRQGDAVNFSNHIVDSWTNVAHNAQASATDLAESMMRSAAAANVVGVSFDTATALAATMIRNTGQGGAIVGNSLKAIYSNIHSAKAIADIEAMGIAVYEFDQKGTKHFRNVEQVLIELMTRIQGTKINLEDVMKDVGGGRFQWSRVAALLGDYSEFIKNYNLSINSAGVADKQVLATLDTITRKAEQVKASMQGLVMGTADAGAARFIKDILDSINSFVKGLQQIPAGVFSAMGSLTKWIVILYSANSALKYIETGIVALTAAKAANTAATIAETAAQATANVTGAAGATASRVTTGAKTAETIATAELATANTALAATTTAVTGGLNLVFAGLIAAGAAGAIYATSVGDAVTQSDNLKQHNIDLLAVKQQEYEMTGKQTEFIGTLGNAYVQFDERLRATGESTEEGIQIRKSMTATEEELKKIVGAAGLERLRAAGYSMEAIQAEQSTHSQAATSIKAEITQLKEAQNAFTDKQIEAVERRIDSLYRETEALSQWRRAQLAAYDFYAGLIEKQISFKEFLLNSMPDIDPNGIFGSMNPGLLATINNDKVRLANDIENDKAYRESLRTTSRDGLNDDIEAAKAELARLKTERLQRTISQYDTGSTVGGDEVNPKPPKNHKTGTGSTTPPADHTQEVFRLDKGREVDHMFKEAKISADQYSAALEILNTRESMFGFSTANASDKLKLMNGRIMELIGNAMDYEAISQQYEQQANDRVASNTKLVEILNSLKVSWKSLSKEEKQAFIQSNKAYIEDEKTLNRLLELSDKLRVAAAEASKTATGIATDTAKLTMETPKKQYQEKTQINELDKNHELALLGYNALESEKRIVELKYAVKELYDAQQELNRVTEAYGKDSLQYKQAQVEVDRLKGKVDQLNDADVAKLRGQLSDMIAEWAVQGKSFNDIWRGVWKEFQVDAIKSLMGVKHEASFLSQALGGTGGGGGIFAWLGNMFSPKKAHTGENITTNAPKMHSGGEVTTEAPLKDDEVIRTLQVGERVLSKEQNKSFMGLSGNLKDLQQKAFQGETYVPVLKPQTMEIAKQMMTNSQDQISREYIAELKLGNKLMMEQNLMLMKSQGNSGNNTVVVAGVSDEQVLGALARNPRAVQGITSQQRSNGFR